MITVDVELPIVSSVPGRVGNWSLRKTMRLTAVPHADDLIELAEGWAAARVKTVVFSDGGKVHVRLVAPSTNSPWILDEYAKLANDHGWEQSGGPWKDQGPA